MPICLYMEALEPVKVMIEPQKQSNTHTSYIWQLVSTCSPETLADATVHGQGTKGWPWTQRACCVGVWHAAMWRPLLEWLQVSGRPAYAGALLQLELPKVIHEHIAMIITTSRSKFNLCNCQNNMNAYKLLPRSLLSNSNHSNVTCSVDPFGVPPFSTLRVRLHQGTFGSFSAPAVSVVVHLGVLGEARAVLRLMNLPLPSLRARSCVACSWTAAFWMTGQRGLTI